MKKIVFLCFIVWCFIVASGFAYNLEEDGNTQNLSFDIVFFLRGETEFGFCNLGTDGKPDSSSPLKAAIDLPVGGINRNEDVAYSLGIYWNIYTGSSYSISLSANGRADGSSPNMMHSLAEDSGFNYTISVDGTGIVIADTSSYVISSGNRDTYSGVSGDRTVSMVIPNSTYATLVDTHYVSYLSLKLTVN